jgi:hypothetical protein
MSPPGECAWKHFKRAAAALKYWQSWQPEFYFANFITIVATICAQLAWARALPPHEKERP